MGFELKHAQSLELLAHIHGVRDWNTLRALSEKPPADAMRPEGTAPSELESVIASREAAIRIALHLDGQEPEPILAAVNGIWASRSPERLSQEGMWFNLMRNHSRVVIGALVDWSQALEIRLTPEMILSALAFGDGSGWRTASNPEQPGFPTTLDIRRWQIETGRDTNAVDDLKSFLAIVPGYSEVRLVSDVSQAENTCEQAEMRTGLIREALDAFLTAMRRGDPAAH